MIVLPFFMDENPKARTQLFAQARFCMCCMASQFVPVPEGHC
jgi:hypothetical protein